MKKRKNKMGSENQREYIDKLMEVIDDESVDVRKKVASEIGKLYNEQQDDFTSYAYVFALAKVSRLQTEDDLFETITEIREVYYKNKIIDNAMLFCDVLVNDAYTTGAVDIISTLNELKDIYETFKCEEISEFILYMAQLVYIEEVEVNEAYEMFKYFEFIKNQHKTKGNIQNFAISIISFCKNVKIKNITFCLNIMKNMYKDDNDLIALYCTLLVHQTYVGDAKHAVEAIEELENLNNKHKNEYTLNFYCEGLCNYSSNLNTTAEETLISLSKISFFEEVLDTNFYIEIYTKMLLNLSSDKNADFGKYALYEMQKLVDKYGGESEDIVLIYNKTLYNYTLMANMDEKVKAIIKSYRSFLKYKYTGIIKIRNVAIESLLQILTKEQLVYFIRNLFVQLENIRSSDENFLKGEEEAKTEKLWYISEINETIFYIFEVLKKNYNDLSEEDRVIYLNKIEFLYKKFVQENIGERLAITLSDIFTNIDEIPKYNDNIVQMFQNIFKTIYENEKTEKTAQSYLTFLTALEILPKPIDEVEKSKTKAKEIFDEFKSDVISQKYNEFLTVIEVSNK